MTPIPFKKKYFVLILVILILSSCIYKNKKQSKGYIKKYYSNGSLKQEGYYINDSIPVDTNKIYDRNGHITLLNIYNRKGMLNGPSYVYYKNGKIKQQRDYTDGKQNGICRNFYKDGSLKSVTFFFDGKQVGDAIFYSKEGYINLYNFFDFFERNRVVKEYNQYGSEVTNIGNKLFIDSIFTINDTLVSIDTFKIAILISHPPRTRVNTFVEEIDSAKNILKKYKIDKKEHLVFLYLPMAKDLYNVRITCSQFDSINDKNRVMIKNNLLK